MATKLIQLSSHLEGLEKEICSKSLTPKQYTLLHKKLDRILKTVQSNTQLPNTSDLREKITELYGQLEDHFAKTKLQKIQRTAERLAKLINTYNGEHRPLVEDKNTLNRLSKASELLVQTEIEAVQKADPEDVYALLSLAKAIHSQNKAAVKEQYAHLPTTLKTELDRHMKKLGKELFKDRTATIQALMALCQELLGHSNGYATQKEINAFFEEMSTLAPKTRSKVISLSDYQ